MPAIYRTVRVARRLAPLVGEAYRRWNALTPEEKERYKTRARGYADRGREIARRANERRPRRRRS